MENFGEKIKGLLRFVRCRFVRFVVVRLGHALVDDVGHVTGVSVHFVVDDLRAAIGQQDAVGAGDDFSVAALLVSVVVVRRIVFDGVGEGVRHRRLRIRQKERPLANEASHVTGWATYVVVGGRFLGIILGRGDGQQSGDQDDDLFRTTFR